jgi:hypothetical protein
MFGPNDAIALFAPALPARTLDKPGAPVGMLKFQFDPLPSHCQDSYLTLPQGMCGVYRACRLSLCLRPFESFVSGGFAVGEGQKSFGRAQGQRLVVRYWGQRTYGKTGHIRWTVDSDGRREVAYSGPPTCLRSLQSAGVSKSRNLLFLHRYVAR